MRKIKFSCLMCVYNGDDPNFVEKALISILLEQTLPPDQLVIVVDGQIPETLQKVIIDFSEKSSNVEFEIVYRETNSGLATSLNDGLKHCRYEIVARMDADDISVKDRFARQIDYIEKHPNIDVIGGQIAEFDEEPAQSEAARFVPLDHIEISKTMTWRNPLRHPTVMFKKSVVLSAGGYPKEYPEDHALWIELLIKGATFANIKDVLVHMRTNRAFFKRRSIRFLFGELGILKRLQRYGLITFRKFVMLSALRIILRLSPGYIKKLVYSLNLK